MTRNATSMKLPPWDAVPVYSKTVFGPKTSIGRGNISFSTINIVRLGIECMNIEDKEQRIARFFAKLDSMLEVTARQLHERMEFQKTAFAKQFPLLMSALWIGSEKLKPNDTIASVINQGTLGIGFIGLAECLVALLGKHHGESGEAQELGLKIVTYMRDRANQFSEQYQHNYSVLATPAEGLSGKFTRIDRKKFGTLPGITDRDYYTNSNHVPVYYKCSARHKAEIEAPYHDLTRGGHIFYVEIDGDATHNPRSHYACGGHDGPVQHRLRLGKSQPQPLPGLRLRKLYRQPGSLSQVRQHPHRQATAHHRLPGRYYRPLESSQACRAERQSNT